MGKRSVHRDIARAARGAASCFVEVELSVRVPGPAPEWSPEGYREVAPARCWAAEARPGWCRVMAVSGLAGPETAMMTGGIVRPEWLEGPCGIIARPWLVRREAYCFEQQPLREWPQADAYYRWYQEALARARGALAPWTDIVIALGHPCGEVLPAVIPDGAALARSGGGWAVLMTAVLDREWLREDSLDAAAAARRVALAFGSRVRARRP